MPTQARIRFSASLLAMSSVLFAAFPLLRPYFALDPLQPEATLAAAAPAITAASWTLAHALATAGFALLLCALPALYDQLAASDAEPLAWRALVCCLAGIALVMPTLGVEMYAMPAMGRVYGNGATEVAPIIRYIYIGRTTAVMLIGLALLAVGAMMFAAALWRTRPSARWAAVTWAVGLALWLPLLPPPVRIADGLAIAIGGAWLARNMWRRDAALDLAVRARHALP